MPPQIKVTVGDVLTYPADVLALKYAQYSYGVDAIVLDRLTKQGVNVANQLPEVGHRLFSKSNNAVSAREVLFVGVEPLGSFDYEDIRGFSRLALSTVARERPFAGCVAMTLHGTGFGLDETEAFRAEIAGLYDAIAEGTVPPELETVAIVEKNVAVAKRLATLLSAILSSSAGHEIHDRARTWENVQTELGKVGHDSRKKPHIFVAMPFAEEYADRYHFGIVGAANDAGFLCERADLASFTGDVISWVKGRIGSASLVVADLSTANPNVYLEVGYAWGRGIDTVLIVPQGDDLKFDVRSQRCLVFKSIRHLKELLGAELSALAHVVTRE